MLVTIGLGTIGVLAGSGNVNWNYHWEKGEWRTPHSKSLWIGFGTKRIVGLQYVEFLDEQLVPKNKRVHGLGWVYHFRVSQTSELSLHSRSHTLGMSFIVPLVISLLSATYPTIAFIRGPLRRYRRRRKGLCIKCGYNLTGNTTGICSECGNSFI